MNCLHAYKEEPLTALKEYWVNTVSTSLIEESLSKFKSLENLDAFMKTGTYKTLEYGLIDTTELNKNDHAFFTLLLYSGYLAKATDAGTYIIPNHEVRTEFYKKFYPLWLKLKLGLDINYYEMFKNLGSNIKDTSVYKTKLEDFINSTKGVQFSEQDFRTIVDGSVIYSSMNQELYKDNLIVELPNEFGERFDSYLYSLGNASFVIECKVLKFSNKLKSLIEDAQ